MVNQLKLDQAVQHILDHPEQHQQHAWTCSTGACLAGWGALLNGYFRTKSNGTVVKSEEDRKVFDEWRLNDEDVSSLSVPIYDVRSVAMKVFDIDGDTATILFASDNTAENIALMAKELSNGETDLTRSFKYDEGGWVPKEEGKN